MTDEHLSTISAILKELKYVPFKLSFSHHAKVMNGYNSFLTLSLPIFSISD
jgi:hypothetical protein